MISYINGETIDSSPARLSDARLVSAAGLVRRFHDATAGTALAAAQEIVAHGDLGPHNIVFSGDTAVAIVDWDHDVAPGSRLVDSGTRSGAAPTSASPTSPSPSRPARSA